MGNMGFILQISKDWKSTLMKTVKLSDLLCAALAFNSSERAK